MNKVGIIHESKGQHIGKAPSLHFSHTPDRQHSLVPRPSPAPVFDRLQYAKTGAGEGLGTRLESEPITCSAVHEYLHTVVSFHIVHCITCTLDQTEFLEEICTINRLLN